MDFRLGTNKLNTDIVIKSAEFVSPKDLIFDHKIVKQYIVEPPDYKNTPFKTPRKLSPRSSNVKYLKLPKVSNTAKPKSTTNLSTKFNSKTIFAKLKKIENDDENIRFNTVSVVDIVNCINNF
jgi:hypothetical protein